MASPSKSPPSPLPLSLSLTNPSHLALSQDERLLFAAKQDATDMLQDIFNLPPQEWDVNYQDGLGNTALHYAASTPSPSVLEALLEFDGTDVDLQNRLDGATPLHVAVKLENEAARQGVIEMLLDAGADPRIKDKHSSPISSYLNPEEIPIDAEILKSIKLAILDLSGGGGIYSADIANDDDDEGEEGSGSGSD